MVSCISVNFPLKSIFQGEVHTGIKLEYMSHFKQGEVQPFPSMLLCDVYFKELSPAFQTNLNI